VNDRGPFAHNRVLDVSERAAALLGFKNAGTARVKIELMEEASRQVAAAAKAGQDTRGFEVALNQQRKPSAPAAVVQSTQTASYEAPVVPSRNPGPVTRVTLSDMPGDDTAPDVITASAAPRPSPPPARDALYTEAGYRPAQATPYSPGAVQVYVQAGAFSMEENALAYSHQLSSFGPSRVYRTQVNNMPYYRVRLGPYTDRYQADLVLSQLQQNGNNQAVIVVD
jgi:rare lipoprotein A